MLALIVIVAALVSLLFGIGIVVVEILTFTGTMAHTSSIASIWLPSVLEPMSTIMAFAMGIFFIYGSIIIFRWLNQQRDQDEY